MKYFWQLGKTLLPAIAIIPVAALLLAFGYLLDPVGFGLYNPVSAFLVQSGSAILNNIGYFFALCISYGLSHDRHGIAAMSGFVGFITVTSILNPNTIALLRDGATVFPSEGFTEMAGSNVFIGILVGLLASWVYNHFYDIDLPEMFSFFSGRKIVPIITFICSIFLAVMLIFLWPLLYGTFIEFAKILSGLGPIGAGIYAFFNRLLLITGLHHALNAVFWFDLIGINDIPYFLMGQQAIDQGLAIYGTTGMYQAGFFPIMMFGLPGAALAMYHTANESRKKVAFGVMLAGALVSFLTGVTEPLEFSFLFVAPPLYLLHSLLTATSVFLAASLEFLAGFGFSAGLIDYVYSAFNPLSKDFLMLIPMGLLYFILYYLLFRFVILHYDLKTIGRDDEEDESIFLERPTFSQEMADQILLGLGGTDNILDFDHCSTKIRATVKDGKMIREYIIKKTGVLGIIRPTPTSIQIIIGSGVKKLFDTISKNFTDD